MTAAVAPSADSALPVRVASGLAGLAGWRRLVLALGLGALASLAFAPLYLLPLLWVSFAGLLWLLDGAERPWQAFLTGWSFGTGHFLVGFYWVGIAFLVEAEKFAVFLPVAVIGLAAGMGLYVGFVCLVTWLGPKDGLRRILVFAAAWLLAEWFRSWVLTGFPWNLMGTVWAFSDAMVQVTAWTGVWGLSLITVVAAALPYLFGKTLRPRWAVSSVAVVGILLAAIWLGGFWRLAAAPPIGAEVVPDIKLRLVQPAIDQSLKWDAAYRQQHVANQIAMSRGPGFETITHVIWSEAAVPYYLDESDVLKEALTQAVPPGGLLFTGAPRRVGSGADTKLHNSLHALDSSGTILANFDKVHLVPFGEFVPLRDYLSFAKVTHGRVDFTPGPGLKTLDLPGLPPVGPLVCYEVIFPGQVSMPGARPGWLLSVTNDAWFGTSTGPYQHLASARLRAVEEGLPMVRVANTGISAVYDSYGREVARLGLNRSGVIDAALPRALAQPTVFARLGNWVILVLLGIVVTLVFVLKARN